MVVAVTHRETHKPTLLQAVACERQAAYSVDSRRKRWDREDRNDIDVHVCLFVYNHVCMRGVLLFLFFCLSVHSSGPLSAYLSISLCPRCICAEFGQHLQSVFCARFVFLSSGMESIPLSERECQLCEAKLSQILWNQLNVHRGLMQIKSMPLCSTRHFIVSWNPITILGSLSLSLTRSFIYSFIHLNKESRRAALLRGLLLFHLILLLNVLSIKLFI